MKTSCIFRTLESGRWPLAAVNWPLHAHHLFATFVGKLPGGQETDDIELDDDDDDGCCLHSMVRVFPR